MAGLAEILEENARLRQALAEREASIHVAESRREAAETELGEAKASLELSAAKLDVATAEINRLERVLELIRLEAAGPKSERYVPDGQLPMFKGPVPPPPRAPVCELPSDEEPGEARGRSGKRAGGRRSRRRKREDFSDLPSTPVVCRLSKTHCAGCGEPIRVFDTATSFRIEWVPGHFEVHDIAREKGACPNCPQEGVLIAPGPYGLDRCMAGNGLLARVICDKFADHIPTNRQAKRMKREGFDIGSQTLSSWLCRLGDLLFPVAGAVRTDILDADAIQGDDTGFPIQDGGDGKLRRGRLWAFTDQQQVFYAFTETKEGKFPNALLEGFDGKLLLADGGSEFNEVVRERDLTRAGCWSHLRTKFFKALADHPRQADLALGTLRDLFAIEATVWGESAEEVLATRHARSRPLVDGFLSWASGMAPLVRPKSRLATAINYALNQEAEMRCFLERGDIPMHNNLSELMLRQAVVGRKNWLFARSEGGARAAAVFYTLIGSCGLQGIDPQTYFEDVLARVLDHPVSRLHELTPKGWREMQARHTLK